MRELLSEPGMSEPGFGGIFGLRGNSKNENLKFEKRNLKFKKAFAIVKRFMRFPSGEGGKCLNLDLGGFLDLGENSKPEI